MIGLDLGFWCGRATSFNPLSLSPALWLDASDASTLFQSNGGSAAAADGDPVGYWLDKSGNGCHASQTSGPNKPLLKLSIQYGKPVGRFNGVSSFLTFSAPQVLPSTVFLVARTNSLQTGIRNFLNRVGSSSPYSPAFYFGQTNNYCPGMYWETSRVCETTTPILRPAIFQYRISSTITGITIDNGSEFTQAFSGSTLTTWNAITSTIQPASFDICEMLIVNSSVSAANKSSMVSYLNSKWGIF
jgi:hypothetical protein